MGIVFNPGLVGLPTPGVLSFNTRTGAVTLLSSDVIAALGYTPLNANGANNGLSLLSNKVVLGGLLTHPTSIGLAGFAFTISGLGEFNVTTGTGSNGANLSLSDIHYILNLVQAGLVSGLDITGASMLVTDEINSKGLVYAADYSANFTARSIPDVGYVLAQIAGAGVTSFNTRTGAVTLLSADVISALGYTPADVSNVVTLTTNQTIVGQKNFTSLILAPQGIFASPGSTLLSGILQLQSSGAGTLITLYGGTGISDAALIYNFGGPNSISIRANIATGSRIIMWPDNSGTVALISDIPTGFVTSFNTRTGAVTLLSADVVSALGYTPANGALYLPLTAGSGNMLTGNLYTQYSSSTIVFNTINNTGNGVSVSMFAVGATGIGVPSWVGKAVVEGSVGLVLSALADKIYFQTNGRTPAGSIDASGNAVFVGNLSAVLPAYSSGTNLPVIYNSTTNRFETSTGGTGVTSFNTRTGAVTLLSADVIAALGYTPSNAATSPIVQTGAFLSPGQTTAQTILNFTAPLGVNMYRIGGFINVGAIVGTSIGMTVTFNDDSGNLKSIQLPTVAINADFFALPNVTIASNGGSVTVATVFNAIVSATYSAGATLESI